MLTAVASVATAAAASSAAAVAASAASAAASAASVAAFAASVASFAASIAAEPEADETVATIVPVTPWLATVARPVPVLKRLNQLSGDVTSLLCYRHVDERMSSYQLQS